MFSSGNKDIYPRVSQVLVKEGVRYKKVITFFFFTFVFVVDAFFCNADDEFDGTGHKCLFFQSLSEELSDCQLKFLWF